MPAGKERSNFLRAICAEIVQRDNLDVWYHPLMEHCPTAELMQRASISRDAAKALWARYILHARGETLQWGGSREGAGRPPKTPTT